MMTDPLTWSPISLGRWSGTQVRVHIFLIVFVVFRLLNAAMSPEHDVLPTLGWLWPLGNLVGPSNSSRSSENALVALAGPIASASVVLVIAIGLSIAGAQLV